MKKVLSLVMILILSLTACGGKGGGASDDPNLGKYIGEEYSGDGSNWFSLSEIFDEGESYIELKDGGKGVFCLGGDATDIKWTLESDGTLKLTRDSLESSGTLKDGMIISRLAFGCTYEQQEAAIARLLYFVEKFWAELLRFSRRTQSQMNRWAARYGIRLTPSEQMNHAKNSCAGRYTAVNLTNADTVEIRMFRGTLKLNTLKATLQMVNHLVEVAISMSDAAVQELSWFDFLDEINEPELIQYLKERRLYVNEPVSASEEE